MSAKRDWGHAKDYVEAMYLMLQQDKPEDFVVATGITTEVRDFVRMAFNNIGVNIEFRGEGADEKGYVLGCSNPEFKVKDGACVVEVDPRYFRPTEVELLIGDPKKANDKLGWKPKYDLKMLVDDMMENDIKLMKKDKYLKDGGYKTLNYFE